MNLRNNGEAMGSGLALQHLLFSQLLPHVLDQAAVFRTARISSRKTHRLRLDQQLPLPWRERIEVRGLAGIPANLTTQCSGPFVIPA